MAGNAGREVLVHARRGAGAAGSPECKSNEALRRAIAPVVDEVAAFWGVGMPVVFREDGAPATNYREVRLPRELAQGFVAASDGGRAPHDASSGRFLRATREGLLAILLHEWGHRTLAPVSAARGVWWAILARMEGIAASHEAVNIAADLLVDRFYLEHPCWGPGYRRAEGRLLHRVLSNPAFSEPGARDPVYGLAVACYLMTGGWWSRWKTRLVPEGLPEDLARRAVACLLDERASLDERMRRFFRVVAPVFHEARERRRGEVHWGVRGAKGAGAGAAPLIGQPHPWREATWDARELVRLLVSSGIQVPDGVLEDVCGPGTTRHVKARLRVLASLGRVERSVARLQGRLRAARPEGAAVWRPGDSLRALDAVLSIERAGLLLPGVTTLRRIKVEGPSAAPGLDVLYLVIDNSGSTQGPIIDTILDAAVGLLEAARRLRVPAAAVVFGSDVVAHVPPGPEYDRIAMLLAALEGQSGGTQMAPALWQAVRDRPAGDRCMATVVFTDSYAFDTASLVGPLRELRDVGPVVMFCVEDRLDEAFTSAVLALAPPPRLVRHRPGQPLVDAALDVFGG